MRRPHPFLQLAELFDCVEDVVVWVKDREGRYRWVNRAFLINYSLDDHHDRTNGDVIGKTDYDFSPAYLADQFRLDDESVLDGKRIVDRIEQVAQPDGRAAWSVTNKIPLVDDRGAIVGTAGISRKLVSPDQAIALGSEFGPVLAYMRDHYHTTITNGHLAKLAHLSVRGVRAQVPGGLPSDAAKVPAEIEDADRQSGAGLDQSVARRGRRRLRVLGPEPFHA